jgi:5-methylcytosine-specific restriction protein B
MPLSVGLSRKLSSLDQLANELLLDRSYLDRIATLLGHKRQAIFYGPPGTGKTYVARRLAQHFARTDEAVELVQFHPSYAYEDFVEGFRPVSGQSSGGFALRSGPLKRIAQRASESPGTIHVLLIDEINRGNLAKVFGELYFLLEYRDADLSLQYSDDPFRLPKNLWILGTMNTSRQGPRSRTDGAPDRRWTFPQVQALMGRRARRRPSPGRTDA